MSWVLRGRAAYVFDEPNFDIDRIIGFEALRRHSQEAVRAALMQAFDPGFGEAIRPGDLLIGGSNFGYGHPHGPPMAAMRELGVAGVVAQSFAPLYLMGELAAGFPQITCPGICGAVRRWDELVVDLDAGWIEVSRTETRLEILPLSAQERRLLRAGGLVSLLRNGKDGAGLAPPT